MSFSRHAYIPSAAAGLVGVGAALVVEASPIGDLTTGLSNVANIAIDGIANVIPDVGIPFTGVPLPCWARMVQMKEAGGLGLYEPQGILRNLPMIANVPINKAKIQDVHRLFFCEKTFARDCVDLGLEAPKKCSDPPCDVCNPGHQPSNVTVDGRNILVDGQIYHMNGVCWSPIDKGDKFKDDKETEKFFEFGIKDIPMMKKAGMNTIRTYKPILDYRVLDLIHENGMKVVVPIFEDGGKATKEDVRFVVNRLKNHPAVLMWSLGNEWNINNLYGDLKFDEVVEWIEMAAAVIRAEDEHNHPIASIYGDAPPALGEVAASMQSIDVWSINIYRYDSFGGFFEEWQDLDISKPFFMGEYGADAWDSRGSDFNSLTKTTKAGGDNKNYFGKYDPQSQATATTNLLKEIYDTSTIAGSEGKKINSGGFIFEWSDEWWKRKSGKPDEHDRAGLAPCWGEDYDCGPAPDFVWNEEWWGLSKVGRNYEDCDTDTYDEHNSRCPLRPAFYAYKDAAKPGM